MRTLLFILAGLALLALAFIGLWLAVSGANLAAGLSHGYPLREELLVHLFLFGIPAASAAWAWRHFSPPGV